MNLNGRATLMMLNYGLKLRKMSGELGNNVSSFKNSISSMKKIKLVSGHLSLHFYNSGSKPMLMLSLVYSLST